MGATLSPGDPIVAVFDTTIDGMLRSGWWGTDERPSASIAVAINAFDRATSTQLSHIEGGGRLYSAYDEAEGDYATSLDENGCLAGKFTWPDVPDLEYPEEDPVSFIARLRDAVIPLSFDAVVGGEYVIEVTLRSEIGTEGGLGETTSLSDFFNTCSYEFRAAYAPADTSMETPLDVAMAVTPEPGTPALLTIGGLGLLARRRR